MPDAGLLLESCQQAIARRKFLSDPHQETVFENNQYKIHLTLL